MHGPDPEDALTGPLAARAAPRLHRHSTVSVLACRAGAREHERASCVGVARELARLTGCRFERCLDASSPAAPAGYLVPDDTLVGLDAARRWGIVGVDDLFGGVVPHAFVATKVITHRLVDPGAAAPARWNGRFAERVRDVVLPGYSVFTSGDARRAARDLLREGPLRVKLASGIGGAGQSVIGDAREFDRWLDAIDPDELERAGAVLECDLHPARTWSVGQVRIGTLCASYFGTQRNTLDRRGRAVYGGSTITVVRGGFDALAPLAAGDPSIARAVAFARAYHVAAFESFEGMFASRCNYDVLEGIDARRNRRCGVLEQSWRIGGASGAEIAALHALCDDPDRRSACAATIEAYGPDVVVPDGATVYFRGDDERLGPITKYAMLRPDAHP